MTQVFRLKGAVWLTALLASPGFATDAGADNSSEIGQVLQEETRVYTGPCFFDQHPEAKNISNTTQHGQAFIEGLGLAGVNAALDLAVGALKAAATTRSAQAVIAFPSNSDFYLRTQDGALTLNPDMACIQIISGSFWDGFAVKESEAQESSVAVPAIQAGQVVTRYGGTVPSDIAKKPKATYDPRGNPVYVARWPRVEGASGNNTSWLSVLHLRYPQLRWARMVFEARLDLNEAAAGNLLSFTPNAFFYDKPIETHWYEFNNQRNVAITLSINKAGSGGAAVASALFPFRDVNAGTLLSPLYFAHQTSAAQWAPQLEGDEKLAFQADSAELSAAKAAVKMNYRKGKKDPELWDRRAYRKQLKAYCQTVQTYNQQLPKKAKRLSPTECPLPLQQARKNMEAAQRKLQLTQALDDLSRKWGANGQSPVSCVDALKPESCKFEQSAPLYPVTVSATVVEVDEPSTFLKWMAATWENAKPALSDAVKARLPEGRAAAAAANAAADEAGHLAQDNYSLAQDAVDNALMLYKLAPDTTNAEKTAKREALSKLVAARIAANQAARKIANEPVPYPNPLEVPTP